MIKLTHLERAAVLQDQAASIAWEARLVTFEIEYYFRLGSHRGFRYGEIMRRAKLLQRRSADLYRQARKFMGSVE